MSVCEVCGRDVDACGRCTAPNYARGWPPDHAAIAACYRLGYERMRADRDSFLNKKRDATAVASRISAERNSAHSALREARAVLLEYRTCSRCAHTYAQHSGHTYSPPYAEPHHCSRGDCQEFLDGFRHPVLDEIDAALAVGPHP